MKRSIYQEIRQIHHLLEEQIRLHKKGVRVLESFYAKHTVNKKPQVFPHDVPPAVDSDHSNKYTLLQRRREMRNRYIAYGLVRGKTLEQMTAGIKHSPPTKQDLEDIAILRDMYFRIVSAARTGREVFDWSKLLDKPRLYCVVRPLDFSSPAVQAMHCSAEFARLKSKQYDPEMPFVLLDGDEQIQEYLRRRAYGMGCTPWWEPNPNKGRLKEMTAICLVSSTKQPWLIRQLLAMLPLHGAA